MDFPLSILDLATVRHGQPIREALAKSLELAQLADSLNYHRLWYAEHHNFQSIASSATSVLIGHVAAHTERIRVGAGGIMLPNHAPLVIAEQFGTLAELFPDRIDLGLGRAPGTDHQTMRALRRDANAADTFPQDVLELQSFLAADTRESGVYAYPGRGTNVPLYILGSSLFGARLAAQLGLPYAFASHFAPQMLLQAAEVYRKEYRPSERHPEPYMIAALSVIAAETAEEADQLYEKAARARVRSMLGRGRNLSDEEVELLYHSAAGHQVLQMLHYRAVGTAETVGAQLREFQELTGADEVMIVNLATELQAQRRTLELVAEL
ncbi:LLM class flavin-dependent oxidoreductase [Micrococcoides hystricis]|uniref:LLM class flavin-dependent oxidoreductase n=1 Tax=Micrococcoides hystricis TaxID=1572761 RepID=A0ABV6P918_9MICC